MNLREYFEQLIQQVESSDLVSNQGKDESGFFRPDKTILMTQLNLLKDLHEKPAAKPMLRRAWQTVVEIAPPELLVLDEEAKSELRAMLSEVEGKKKGPGHTGAFLATSENSGVSS